MNSPFIILGLALAAAGVAYAKNSSTSGENASDPASKAGPDAPSFLSFLTPTQDVATSSQNDFMDHPSTFTSSQWRRFDAQFKSAGQKWSVDWTWLKGICLNESYLGTDPRVVAGQTSSDGKSWGIMQFTIPTACDMLGVAVPDLTDTSGRQEIIDQLNDPDLSIDIAGKFVWINSSRFGGDQRKVIMSYNQGAGATAQGKEYAADYYDRFVRNLQMVLNYL